MDVPAAHGDRLGLVVGSSLAVQLLVAETSTRHDIDTAWGAATVLDVGTAVVLPRHGLDTFTPAHRVDHRRNIAALCAAGCNRALALASVGTLRGWPVGTVVAPFDFFAPFANPSFYEDRRGHTVPGFDEAFRDEVIDAWREVSTTAIMDGGVYAQTRGPRFETPAEIRMLADYADIVGMTIAEECILAREAGLAYAVVATVDNLANGVAGEALTIEEFYANVATNQEQLAQDLTRLLPVLAERGTERGTR